VSLRRAACFVALLTALAVSAAGAQTAAKKTAASAADLPAFTYALGVAPSALLQADAPTFGAFGARVQANVDAVLADYDIADHATLRDLLEQKLELELLSGTEDAAALATAQQIRALEDKADAKLLSGITAEAVVAARAESGATSGDAYLAAFQRHYAAALAPLPWAVVGSALKEAKTEYEILTPSVLIGALQGNADPAAAKTHGVSGAVAALLVRYRFFLNVLIPLRAQGTATIAALVAQHSVQRPDIWAARDVTLHEGDKLTPVRIAIWDSGTDVSLFRRQLFTDPAPGGFDPHGLAFDLLWFKTHGDLGTLTPAQRAVYVKSVNYLEGVSDLQESFDTPAATTLKKVFTTIAPRDVPAFLEGLQLASIYAHGTHVAGIALRGNPAARLVVARMTFDYKTIPTAPTEAIERRAVAGYMTYVAYFRAHHVRVVNMSWGGTQANAETALEKNGIGKDAADRKAIAHKLYLLDRTGLEAAIASAPEILFVCAAGNGDSDAGFTEEIPAGLERPNLLAVGAVDRAGDETSFTSYGKTVRVDADGEHIQSVIPGGGNVKLSGTSFAAPYVANLAAKLIAIDPALTPVQTIDLIRRGATPAAGGRLHNVDPQRSVQLLRQELAR
jgi:hypothetical protein